MSSLAKFAVVAVAICAFALWMVFFRTTQEDRDFESAERRRSVEAMRSFQRRYPGGKRADDAKRAIGRIILDGRDKIVATAADASRPELEQVTALLEVLAKRGDPIVIAEVADPDVSALAAADAALAGAGPGGTHIAPLAPSIGRSATSYRYDVADAFETVFTEMAGDSIVLVDKWDDVSREGRPIIRVEFAVRAGDNVFAQPNHKRAFVGVVLDVRMAIELPKRSEPIAFEATVAPAADFSFTTDMLSGMMTATDPTNDSRDRDVYAGMVKSAFEQFVRAWIAHATGATAAGGEVSELERLRSWCEDSRDQAACARLGLAYLEGDGVERDDAQAAKLLRSACTGFGTGGAACAPLAWMYLRGQVPERDSIGPSFAAVTMATFGCDMNDGPSCELVGDFEVHADNVLPFMGERIEMGSVPDPKKAVVQYVRGCDAGALTACAKAAALFDGKQLPVDPSVAAVLARKACPVNGEPGHCEAAAIAEKAAAKRPSKTVFGVAIPRGAAIFDVRYAMVFADSPALRIWLAAEQPSVSGSLASLVSRAPNTVDVVAFDAADPNRPTTSAPPEGTRAIIGVTPNSGAERCEPCFQGISRTLGCRCP